MLFRLYNCTTRIFIQTNVVSALVHTPPWSTCQPLAPFYPRYLNLGDWWQRPALSETNSRVSDLLLTMQAKLSLWVCRHWTACNKKPSTPYSQRTPLRDLRNTVISIFQVHSQMIAADPPNTFRYAMSFWHPLPSDPTRQLVVISWQLCTSL